MTQKIFNKIKNVDYEELAETRLWKELNDFQKSIILLQSNRLADQQEFLEEFISFEQPDIKTSVVEKK